MDFITILSAAELVGVTNVEIYEELLGVKFYSGCIYDVPMYIWDHNNTINSFNINAMGVIIETELSNRNRAKWEKYNERGNNGF